MNATRMFLGGVLVALVLVIAVMIWVDRATPITVEINAPLQQDVRVFIDGAVATPGVVTVSEGARLADVAEAAGGFTGDADYSLLNLAGRVGDGENVTIPSIGGTVNGTPVTDVGEIGTSAPSGAPLDINVATVAELEELPGIGEVLANRIVDYRNENGPFSSVDDLATIEGISAHMVDDLRPLVTVSDGG